MSRKLFPAILIGVLMIFGISAVFAQDGVITINTEEAGTIVGIGDGRLNAFDQAAPVAVYYTNECSIASNEVGQLFLPATGLFVDAAQCTRLDILAIDPVTGNGSLALELYPQDVSSLFTQGERSISDNGVTLNIREDGQFWVVTAPDFEGKVYTFSWFDLGRTLTTLPFTPEVVVTAVPTAAPVVTVTEEPASSDE